MNSTPRHSPQSASNVNIVADRLDDPRRVVNQVRPDRVDLVAMFVATCPPLAELAAVSEEAQEHEEEVDEEFRVI